MNTETSNPSEKQQDEPAAGPLSKGWRSWLVFAAIAITLYFGNVELQTFLGRQALEKVDFPALSLEQALDKAARENKYVLADMAAIWCPSCRKLDREVFADHRVRKAINSDYVFVRIEYESAAGRAFQQRYDVDAFPTLLVLKPTGEKLRQLGLTFKPDKFISQL